MNARALERVVAGIVRSLPPNDESVGRLLDAASYKYVPDEVCEIIARDPNLCADLLYLANSPCWRPNPDAPPIDTIEEALEHIGVEPLCMLVGPSYVRQTIRPDVVLSKHWHDYEDHSREISQVCRTLTRILGMPEHEQQRYCAAGLTHDIGRAVIMLAGAPDAATLVGTSPEKLDEIVADEEEVYGMNHCQIGEQLFRKWRVSKVMSEGILRHHSPMVEDDFNLPGAIIFVSHFVAMSDLTGDIIAHMLPDNLLGELNMGPREIEQARKELAFA